MPRVLANANSDSLISPVNSLCAPCQDGRLCCWSLILFHAINPLQFNRVFMRMWLTSSTGTTLYYLDSSLLSKCLESCEMSPEKKENLLLKTHSLVTGSGRGLFFKENWRHWLLGALTKPGIILGMVEFATIDQRQPDQAVLPRVYMAAGLSRLPQFPYLG